MIFVVEEVADDEQKRMKIQKKVFSILGRTGFEPVTNGLKGHCSTN